MKNALTPRERVALALKHRETDRVPIAMVCSGINPAARAALERHLGETRGVSVEQFLKPFIDIVPVQPRYVGPTLPPDTDIWGVKRRAMSYGLGAYDEIEHYPLAGATTAAAVAAHPWPSLEWHDYESIRHIADQLDEQGEYCLLCSNGNIFETSWYMRGFEQMFLDLVTQPDIAHAIMQRVTSYYIGFFSRLLRAAKGRIDLAFTADDIGGQNGLLLSLAMWEEHLKPYHVRLNAAIHESGARVIYHSDGAVMEAVPGLLDAGIDVLQALQFDARGMDPVALKRSFGDRLCFEGGISVQKTLPFGTVEEVRREVTERKMVLGKGGGYILGPSHTIQDGTPPENIVALFETAAS